LPVILGHEFAGTVVATGAGVSGLAPGTTAAIRSGHSCGACVRLAVMERSRGLGAAAAFDAAGVEGSVTGIIRALAPRGKVVVVAIHEQALERFNPTALLRQETAIVGSLPYDDADFRAVIAAMADGHYSTDGWVEHAPLDALPDAFDDLRAGRAIKVLIDL